MLAEKRKYSCIDNSADSDSQPPNATSVYLLRGYYSFRKGEREDMQDAHVIKEDCANSFPAISGIDRIAYFAVFDGHGGAKASAYCAEHLHTNLASKFPKGSDFAGVEKELKRCFIESYKKTDDDFLKEAMKVKPVWKDGTTATTILVLNNILYVANLGDSRALLCRYKEDEKKEVGLVLTRDHNPTVFEERMRIQKTGGNVKDGRVMGVLEVSRSIGDGQFKNHGVTCVPDVKRCALTASDRYLVVACDGLWKAFTNQQLVDFVSVVLKEDKIAEPTEGKTEDDRRWEHVANRLAAEAVLRGSGDNVTVVVVRICPS